MKLPQTGAFILTGDAVHFRENLDTDGVPAFNFDRAQTVASMERIKKIAANLKATSSSSTMRATSENCRRFPRRRSSCCVSGDQTKS